jgi:phospho-N-acetylmuramoyl-pentapeptide-transferase
MFYWLYTQFIDSCPYLNILKYITFRSGAAVATALIISFLLGEKFILFLKSWQRDGQPIRDDGPQTHLSKKGTPTMGGVMILISIIVSTLLWVDLSNSYVWVVLFVLTAFGALGFLDDYKKVKLKNSKGVSGRQKLAVQFTVSLIAAWMISVIAQTNNTHIAFPFIKDFLLNLGILYFIFVCIVITGASNAVNLTDGLDGLVIGPVMLVALCYGLISYLVGNAVFAEYLQIHPVPKAGEVMVFCAAIIGAGLGFLWYNAQPAQIFMGDVGSLALGGAIGTVSVITKHEILLAIIGGLFVIEAVSVMIQVFYFKTTGKRFFRMAPIHHHFEKLGWSETKVVMRFWIVAIIFALIGMATLKLR